MSLGNILDNFDASKDRVNAGSQGLPSGEYDVIIDSIGHKVYDSGFECFLAVFQVVVGEHNGEKEYDNINLATKKKDGAPMPEFVISTNVKAIGALAYICNVDMEAVKQALNLPNETDQYQALDELFHGKQGIALKLIVKHSRNKKDPDNPFTSYEFEKVEQPDEIEVKDEDLPFGDSPASEEVPDESEDGSPF